MSTIGFLATPQTSAAAQTLFDDDLAEVGYVMNVTKLWAYRPESLNGLYDLLGGIISAHGMDHRQRGILVGACAATLGDSYCALSWGSKLAKATDEETAAGVIKGSDEHLTEAERAMAAWARKVVRDPNGTSSADVQELRDAGFSDEQIFAITVFVAFRIAFSTVNDALGTQPDVEFRSRAPQAILDAVGFGRPIADR
ncbi:MAG: hypothetical protein L0Y54_23385 [Sporichthyaceae bacterium]|nr:hypothetical protein [Sporichthyaceae bacterium]